MTSLSYPNPPEKPLQLDDFCRICLLRKAQLRPLTTQFSGVMIPEMLYKVTGTPINMQDQLPRVICDRCLAKVDLAIALAEEFRKQEEKLRRFWWKGGVLVDELVAYAQTEDSWRKTHSEEVIERLASGRLDTVPVVEQQQNPGPLVKTEQFDASTYCIEVLSDDSGDEANGEQVQNKIDSELERILKLEDPQPAGVLPAKLQEERLVKQECTDQQQTESILEQDDADKDLDYVPDDIEYRNDEPRPSPVESEPGVTEDDDSKSDASSDTELPRLKKGSTKCPVCDQEFKKWEYLKRHHRRHVLLAKGRYKCKECGRIFASNVELRMHKLTHVNASNSSLVCAYCKKSFKYYNHFVTHQKKHELRKDPLLVEQSSTSQQRNGKKRSYFQCKVCGRAFIWECRLKRHEALHEQRMSGENKFPKSKSQNERIPRKSGQQKLRCELCPKIFLNESERAQHLQRHKNVESGKFRCNHCYHSFGTFTLLKRHSRTACEKITPAIEVTKVSTSRTNHVHHSQRSHARTKSGEHFQCPDCGERYGQRVNLRRHQQEVHNLFIKAEDGVTILHCTECDTLFSSSESYEIHLQGHREEEVTVTVGGRYGRYEESIDGASNQTSNLPIIQEVTGSFIKSETPLQPTESQREPHPEEDQDQARASGSEHVDHQFTDGQKSLEASGYSIEVLSDCSDDEISELAENELEQSILAKLLTK